MLALLGFYIFPAQRTVAVAHVKLVSPNISLSHCTSRCGQHREFGVLLWPTGARRGSVEGPSNHARFAAEVHPTNDLTQKSFSFAQFNAEKQVQRRVSRYRGATAAGSVGCAGRESCTRGGRQS